MLVQFYFFLTFFRIFLKILMSNSSWIEFDPGYVEFDPSYAQDRVTIRVMKNLFGKESEFEYLSELSTEFRILIARIKV